MIRQASLVPFVVPLLHQYRSRHLLPAAPTQILPRIFDSLPFRCGSVLRIGTKVRPGPLRVSCRKGVGSKSFSLLLLVFHTIPPQPRCSSCTTCFSAAHPKVRSRTQLSSAYFFFVGKMLKRKCRQTPLTNLSPVILPVILPDELLNIIVRMACHSSNDESEPPAIDVKMMHSFALVSKPLYNLVTPFLYAHVRLTKPSDVLLYARTVSLQPSLAMHTKTLWIGPDESHAEAQEDCWPLDKDCTAIKSSIPSLRDCPMASRSACGGPSPPKAQRPHRGWLQRPMSSYRRRAKP